MEKVTLWDGAGGTPSRPTLVTSASWGTALDAMVNEEEEDDLLCLWITFLCYESRYSFHRGSGEFSGFERAGKRDGARDTVFPCNSSRG